MDLDTRPAALDSKGGADSLVEFRVTSAIEIGNLLRQLRDGSTPVILNAPDGASYTTTLWSYDSQSRRMVFSADEHHTQPSHLVDVQEVTAVAYLENVKIQFDVPRLVFVRGSQSCALQGEYPRALYRFQRRGSYRVRTLDRSSPAVNLRHPSIPEMVLSLRIIDVSIGGCALLLPDNVPALQPGTNFQAVHVDLDADTRFSAGLLLHHVSSLHSGPGHRLGCEWVRIDASAQRALQRYIDGAQKRRRMLALG